jgi:hypothetical protein
MVSVNMGCGTHTLRLESPIESLRTGSERKRRDEIPSSGGRRRMPTWAWIAAWAGVILVASPDPAIPQSGQAGGPDPSGYTCCNFHPDGNWISDANWAYLPRIPAGTAARILEYGDYRASVEIGGRPMMLGLDYGRSQNLREWAQRMIVSQDPKEKIADWPAAAREAIEAGRIALGMTKEQVVVSVGYPPAHATPAMDAETWKYWYDTHGTYEVVWGNDGRVKDVVAPPPIRTRVLTENSVDAPASVTGHPVQLKDLESLLPGPGGTSK